MELAKEKRFHHRDLIDYSFKLLTDAGLEDEKAVRVAQTLIEADLMGHTTHGIRLLPAYLSELEKGNMVSRGEATTVSDYGSAITWDGNFLPGPWLMHKALDLALSRIEDFPVLTIVIRKSHHIGCLATYPERVTQQGFVMLLTCTDPSNRIVAPFGGSTAVLGSNPIAAGIPATENQIIFDISTSETAGGQIQKAFTEGEKLHANSILMSNGSCTNDPADFLNTSSATILPLGGTSFGYKGTALGILSEALTNGLGGYGRKDESKRWCASIFMQIINPAAFGGKKAFIDEMDFLTDSCRNAVPLPGRTEMRLPGDRALLSKAIQKQRGLRYNVAMIDQVNTELEKYGIPFPQNF